MPGFRRRRLPLLFCCLFASAQTVQAAVDTARAAAPLQAGKDPVAPAEQWATELAPVADPVPVSLRLERKFNILTRQKPQQLMRDTGVLFAGNLFAPPETSPAPKDQYPAFITADELSGRADEEVVAEGNAEFRRHSQFLWADKLTHWPLADEIEAVGNVRLQNGNDEISGPYMRMKLSEQIGYFDNADFKVRKEVANSYYRRVAVTSSASNFSSTTGNAPMTLYVPSTYELSPAVPTRRPSDAYGHAERMDFEGENHIRLTNTTYSTCKPGERDWYLRADSVTLDYDENKGKAESASL